MTNSEKTTILENLLAEHKAKEKKNYLAWEVLRTQLGGTGRKKFGLTAKATLMELKMAIEPFLGDHLMLAYKDDILCLAVKMSSEEWAKVVFEENHTVLKEVLVRQK